MIYVMSDVHGCYDKYMQTLEKIAFKEHLIRSIMIAQQSLYHIVAIHYLVC